MDVSTPQVGGIVSTNGDRISNNTFDRWMERTCIRRESAHAFISGNIIVDISEDYTESVPDATKRDGPADHCSR